MALTTVTQDGTTVALGDNDKVTVDIPGGGAVTIEADPNDDVEKIQIEFGDDDEADHVTINLSSFDQDDLQIDIKQYDPSDSLTLEGVISTFIDPDNPDEYQFTYLGADGQIHTGYIKAKDGGEKDFTDPFSPIQIICFGDATLIATPTGEVLIEDLKVGDLVLTRDHGAMPIRWIGRKHLDTLFLARAPHLQPILVRASALGAGLPHQDLILSPNHRVMLTDWRAEYLFGEVEVLVAIKSLVNDKTILRMTDAASVTYHHILLDHHAIVRSNGIDAESLLPGPMALQSLDVDASREILDIFPDLQMPDAENSLSASAILKTFEATAMEHMAI